ncbi:MAG: hypothetical protein QNJ67_12510 [Kiloniellales bacterium]|nr:hypothetical protein [Kiloniellales bacterium]
MRLFSKVARVPPAAAFLLGRAVERPAVAVRFAAGRFAAGDFAAGRFAAGDFVAGDFAAVLLLLAVGFAGVLVLPAAGACFGFGVAVRFAPPAAADRVVFVPAAPLLEPAAGRRAARAAGLAPALVPTFVFLAIAYSPILRSRPRRRRAGTRLVPRVEASIGRTPRA